MSLVFLAAQVKRDNSIVDIAWSIGFILIAISTLVLSGQFLPKQTFMSAMVIVWGMRLAIHISARNLNRGEDFRYKKWRGEWGKNFQLRSFLQVFMLQGFLMLIVAGPIILVNSSPEVSFTPLDTFSYLIWLSGLLFESVSDLQLLTFKNNPKNRGRIFREGLFKYSRHPNYFGEFLIWWGIFLMAVTAPFGWVAIASPFLMTFLLTRVSGVPLLEKKYIKNKEYQGYVKSTSAFIPWFPKPG